MLQAEIGKDLSKARELLNKSELVAIPTETVYGLAGNAFDENAILRIFEVKKRPKFDPLIVHTDSLAKIKEFVEEIPVMAVQMAKEFWPGPLTMLLPKKKNIPDLITSGSPFVAVRIPRHPLTLNLLASIDFPLAAPSANPFGYISPTTPAHVDAQLGKKIHYILDGGECSVGIESTIVKFEENAVKVLRLGGISFESIKKLAANVELELSNDLEPAAPGMLKSHYAPHIKLVIGKAEQILLTYKPEEVGSIVFQKPIPGIPLKNQIVLSPDESLDEAAKNLFGALRKLDLLPVKIIVAELVPEKGIGRAINDRLRRASAEK
jgi:L-threonylcarbamoyladenylate synthase